MGHMLEFLAGVLGSLLGVFLTLYSPRGWVPRTPSPMRCLASLRPAQHIQRPRQSFLQPASSDGPPSRRRGEAQCPAADLGEALIRPRKCAEVPQWRHSSNLPCHPSLTCACAEIRVFVQDSRPIYRSLSHLSLQEVFSPAICGSSSPTAHPVTSVTHRNGFCNWSSTFGRKSAASCVFPFVAVQGYQPMLFDYQEEKAAVPLVWAYICHYNRCNSALLLPPVASLSEPLQGRGTVPLSRTEGLADFLLLLQVD